jgi:hypothetical protein
MCHSLGGKQEEAANCQLLKKGSVLWCREINQLVNQLSRYEWREKEIILHYLFQDYDIKILCTHIFISLFVSIYNLINGNNTRI